MHRKELPGSVSTTKHDTLQSKSTYKKTDLLQVHHSTVTLIQMNYIIKPNYKKGTDHALTLYENITRVDYKHPINFLKRTR